MKTKFLLELVNIHYVEPGTLFQHGIDAETGTLKAVGLSGGDDLAVVMASVVSRIPEDEQTCDQLAQILGNVISMRDDLHAVSEKIRNRLHWSLLADFARWMIAQPSRSVFSRTLLEAWLTVHPMPNAYEHNWRAIRKILDDISVPDAMPKEDFAQDIFRRSPLIVDLLPKPAVASPGAGDNPPVN